MDADELFNELRSTYAWSQQAYDLARQADFCCSYCGCDMLNDFATYRFSQTDHLLPKSRYARFESEPSNHVNSCLMCNMLKGHWDPNRDTKEEPLVLDDVTMIDPEVRTILIERTRRHLNQLLEEKVGAFRAMSELIRKQYPRDHQLGTGH